MRSKPEDHISVEYQVDLDGSSRKMRGDFATDVNLRLQNIERKGNLRNLVAPWVGIVVLAMAIAMASSLVPSSRYTTPSMEVIVDASYEETDRLLSEYVGDDYPQHEEFHESIAAAGVDVKSESHESHESEHADLFPLDRSDFIGFFCAMIGLMIAAGGGIGGGGILVPIYILIFGFSPKHAIPLSNVTVLGGALANTILNTPKRHPLADRPLVDWDLILVMEPLTIAGALIGAFLNKLLPEILLTVLLVVLLTFTAHKTLTKAFKMYKIETRLLLEEGLLSDGATKQSELTTLSHKQHDNEDAEATEKLLDDSDPLDEDCEDKEAGPRLEMEERVKENGECYTEEENKELQLLLEAESKVPKDKLGVLIVMFIVVLFINLLKGGGAFRSPVGITCGSTSFWLANGGMLVWIILVSIFIRSYLVSKWEQKHKLGFTYVEGDIQWDARATIVYPVVCCLAGFFAGMFGVGGGIVKGPLMLAMGVHPAVSSASSACMILFTSFTATTSFVVFGLLVSDYAVACFCLGFCATWVGQVGLNIIMKKNQRNSYIAFSIGGVVALSSLLMTIQSLLSIAEGKKGAGGGICD